VNNGELVGVVTDRDMYIALATQNARPSQLTIGEVARGPVVSCAPEDDVHEALVAMKRARVRRLPVIGFGNTILGVLSIDDVVRAAGEGKAVTSQEVVETLQAITGLHHPVPHVVAA
jgi:CBS domain-containing protein